MVARMVDANVMGSNSASIFCRANVRESLKFIPVLGRFDAT
jgi:hypothetical protein